ncbi:MAG: DUF3124 domain-containing protein [Bacteroidales bacterium]|nr:DUF3124 domain-containing protein [Bacteroidales bacterium]
MPIYSDIYHIDGHRRFLLTSTLSIRSTTQKDSLFVFNIDCYDSKGNLLCVYIDSALILRPLESLEFVVEYDEKQGGAGANFIVNWGSYTDVSNPCIQAVMISTHGQQGVSFVTDGINLEN